MDFNFFIKKINMPEEGAAFLFEILTKIKERDEYKALTNMMGLHISFSEIEKKSQEAATVLGVHPYTLQMILLCDCAEVARNRYLQRGVKDELFWAISTDIVNKLIECKAVKGIWGTFVFPWFENYYEAVIFQLGRLQFIRKKFHNGVYALDVHIPSCGPLHHDDVIKSYKMAYDFFENTHGDYMAFHCCSWLLYTDFRGEVFKEHSNTLAFAEDFIIFQHDDDPNFTDCWRLFNVEYDGNLDNLPEDTSMRRAMKAHVKNGGTVGQDIGGFLFDGEKILREESEILREGLVAQ